MNKIQGKDVSLGKICKPSPRAFRHSMQENYLANNQYKQRRKKQRIITVSSWVIISLIVVLGIFTVYWAFATH